MIIIPQQNSYVKRFFAFSHQYFYLKPLYRLASKMQPKLTAHLVKIPHAAAHGILAHAMGIESLTTH